MVLRRFLYHSLFLASYARRFYGLSIHQVKKNFWENFLPIECENLFEFKHFCFIFARTLSVRSKSSLVRTFRMFAKSVLIIIITRPFRLVH